MIERQISTNTVAAGAAWTATVVLYVIAAGLLVAGRWKVALLIAEIACGTSAYAAVRHLRCYAAGICNKIDDAALERDVSRLTGVPQQERRPVR